MSSREPQARKRHAAVSAGQKFYVWAGDSSSTKIQATTFERFDVCSETWEEPQQLNGSLPNGLRNVAVATDGKNAYTFGGASSSHSHLNSIYQIDLSTLQCKELAPRTASFAPRKGSCMVYFNQKLVVVGGYTHQDMTEELLVFDLRTKEWSAPPTTGEAPHSLSSHTFTKIDHHRAVVFGGHARRPTSNDTYVLDMETWHWTKLKVSGTQPSARSFHAACCIAGPLTGQQHPLLMVVGGNDGVNVLGDVWLLDVDKGTWTEVTLPVAITPRDCHSVAVFGSGPSFRIVVLFGGKKTNYVKEDISETTLLWLERSGRTAFRSASWQVTRVVMPDELGRPDERLKEQMRKLGLSSKGRASGMDLSLREEQERRAEAERQVEELTQRVSDSEQLIEDLTLQAEEAQTRAMEATERSREMEGRLREMEGRLSEMEGRWRDARETANALQRQLERNQDPSWMVERREIRLTQQELGRGAWATVKVAEFRGLQVAAKCLHSIIISDYNRQLFVREMNIAAKLRHPNLIQFLGATLEGEPVIIIELMTTSLRALLEQGPLSAANITSIGRDVARALNYLHLTKPDPIIHRDVSSANVLLNMGPNSTWLAKLSDYGSANFVQRVTTAGPGNPAYSAPEASNPSQQSTKMDVYSYGVLLVEMATRRFPDKDTLLLQIQQINFPGLPGVIRRCIHDDPARRPHMSDVLTQL